MSLSASKEESWVCFNRPLVQTEVKFTPSKVVNSVKIDVGDSFLVYPMWTSQGNSGLFNESCNPSPCILSNNYPKPRNDFNLPTFKLVDVFI